jgi:peptidoglycan biosynthesis protein MviN/MurJ (putative lipid II flippase)
MKDLAEIVDKVKGVEDGVNNLVVPLLKDTIADSNRHNKRLFISNVVLIIVTLVISIASMIIIAYENNRYADFLSQYDFSSEVYQETNDSSNINDGIRIMK